MTWSAIVRSPTDREIILVGENVRAPIPGTGEVRVPATGAFDADRPANAIRGATLAADGTVTPATVPDLDLIADTREYLKSRYRLLEGVPGLQAWNLLSTDHRAGAYTRWVWNNAAASSIDANLATEANRAVLVREAEFDPGVWYDRFFLERTGSRGTGGSGTSWDTTLGISLVDDSYVLNRTPAWTPPAYYPTVDSDSASYNSWGWVAAGQIETGANIVYTGLASDYHPVHYLHG